MMACPGRWWRAPSTGPSTLGSTCRNTSAGPGRPEGDGLLDVAGPAYQTGSGRGPPGRRCGIVRHADREMHAAGAGAGDRDDQQGEQQLGEGRAARRRSGQRLAEPAGAPSPASRPSSTPAAAASTVAATPMVSECRAPCTTRANTSRPRWSVPNQCAAFGGAQHVQRVGGQRVGSGEQAGHRQRRREDGAAPARPASATPGGRRTSRGGRPPRRVRLGHRAAPSQPRVDDAGTPGRPGADGDVDHRRQQHHGHHHRHVLAGDRLQGDLADAGPAEHRLGDDRAAEQRARTASRRAWRRAAARAAARAGPAPRTSVMPRGPRGDHERLAPAPAPALRAAPGRAPRRRQREGERGQHQRRRPCAAGDREPAEPEREHRRAARCRSRTWARHRSSSGRTTAPRRTAAAAPR